MHQRLRLVADRSRPRSVIGEGWDRAAYALALSPPEREGLGHGVRMQLTSILLYVPLGAAAGVASGLIGIGGGVIIVPALVLAGFSEHKAQGATLAMLVVPRASSPLCPTTGRVRRPEGRGVDRSRIPARWAAWRGDRDRDSGPHARADLRGRVAADRAEDAPPPLKPPAITRRSTSGSWDPCSNSGGSAATSTAGRPMLPWRCR